MLLAGLVLLAGASDDDGAVDFQRDVRPLLSDRCFVCHGPDAGTREADLRLDTRAGATEDRGGYAAVVPGDAADSELVYRIRSEDDHEVMPPADSGLTLSPEEVALLERWVAEGAEYRRHWSFEPPADPPAPAVDDEDWARDPLDRYVLARLEAEGLAPAPAADRATWLRRTSFALTGLPPTPDELAAFLADDAPGAHGRVADRLLASPHFGERMARGWLDLARYSDTFGYQSDVERRVWPYRDWVIEAYDANLPYDDFVRDQLAGDLLPDATRDQRVATAFNRLHRQTNEGGSTEEEYRVEYVADRVHTFGTAFLGLTFECARCHDHKYDPVSQREYYSLFAYFDDIDESGLYSHFTRATPTPALDLPTGDQATALAEAEARVAALEAELAALAPAAPPDDRALEAPSDQAPTARYTFDARADAGWPDAVDPARHATGGGVEAVEGERGGAVRLAGDAGLRFDGVGSWRRSDPFSVAVTLRLDRVYERAVVLHRSRAWTDAASQGWQLLVEDGRLTFALVHFWPGDAIAVTTEAPLPTDAWVDLCVTYDGSSRADGLRVYVDGAPAAATVVRDHLTRGITGGGPGAPTLGERFRDKGLAGGVVDDVQFFDRELVAGDAAVLAGHAEGADPAARWARETRPESVELRGALREARRARDDARDRIPQLMAMEATAAPRQAYLLTRGSYELRADPVEPGVPAALALPGREPPRDRLELAEWLLDPEHPLTARVEVDRLWGAVFGRGLVPTPEDLGSQGAQPAHPALLDHLARSFVASGWDRKALLRRLVLSATFRQSSAADEPARATDPENALFGRGPSRRLAAEEVRDLALAASGLLVPTVGGPSVRPYQPAGLWREKSGATYVPDTGDGLWRRSLYTFWKLTSPPPTMILFDASGREVCVARRAETNTPLQALVLWNDPQLVEAARVLAARLLRERDDDAARVGLAFELLAGRAPREAESAALLGLLDAERAAFAADPARAEALRAVGQAPAAEDLPAAEHAAWSLVVSALLSSDPAVVLR